MSLKKSRVSFDPDEVADLCRRRHVRKLALFGSALRDDFSPDSDVDVLIEFEPGCAPGWEIVDIEDELSGLLGGRRVDLVNPRFLNHRIKDRVLGTAVVQYGAGHGA